MKAFFVGVFLLCISSIAILADGQRNPNDTCDERVNRWCDFDSGLWCRAGKCQCFKNYMTFDLEQKRCLSKVWFPCGDLSTGDVKLPYTHCVNNANCVISDREKPNGAQECRCNKGFKETDEGFCS